MAEFLPHPHEASVKIYVPGPPTFILDGQTTFQLIWTEYLLYTPQESMDAFFRSLHFTQQILGEPAQDDFLDFLVERNMQPVHFLDKMKEFLAISPYQLLRN